jgi:Ca-activated chloride channel homolog
MSREDASSLGETIVRFGGAIFREHFQRRSVQRDMKRIIALSALLGFSLASSLWQCHADGLIVVHESHWRPGPRPPHPRPPHWPPAPPVHVFAPLEVVYHHVNVKIDGQIATTSVDQEFYNPNPQRLEGTYLFPVPAGAHIDKFTMDIGGKMVEAELLPADKARQIYEDIVRKARDPALLEYVGRDVFKVRIFPIEPNSRKRVKLAYTQLLKPDAGLTSYVYPLNTEKFSAAPIKNVSVKVELETKRPLKTIYSPSHTVEIKRDGSNKAVVGYEANDVKPDADFQLCFSAEKDELGVNLLTYRTSGDDGFFVLLASPGVDVKEKQLVLKDVVFVLDTSGSMAGRKLEQAKKALQFCVENLNSGDRFEIVRFSTEVEPLFDKLVAATPENRKQAGDFIKELRPMGGTAIDEALKKALTLRDKREVSDDSLSAPGGRGEGRGEVRAGDRPLVVIFLTDGQPTIGTTDEEQIVAGAKRAAGSTRVFCFGIGTDVNTHLLDKITGETRAFSQYVLPEENIEVKVSNFFTKIKEPVLANPRLTFTGGVRVTKIYPSSLPDIFKGEQLVVAGRYSGDGASAVIIEGTVNGQSKKFTYEVNFPRESTDQEFIPRLWATRRVGWLLDEIRLRGESGELKDEVTELARKYSLVTPYTAYLIVEDETKRNVPVPMQTMSQLYDDKDARKLAKTAYDSLSRDKAGEAAVANARGGVALNFAAAPAEALAFGRAEAMRNLATLAPAALPARSDVSAVSGRVAQYTQQQKFVNNRSFFQNGNQWIDSEVQKQQAAKRMRLQFNTPEYFAFAASNSAARPWLALGQNVQFVLNHTIYEIYE